VLVPWFEKKMSTALQPKPFPIPEKNHVIICGYGTIINEVMDSLRIHGFDYIIITEDRSDIEKCRKEKIPYVYGDPSNDEVLKKANIHTCVSLIAASDDALDAFICLTAKSLRNDLNIIAIADKTEHVKALYAAGASRVINPKIFAGSILGRRAGHEFSLEVSGKFAVFGDLEIRQYAIPATSPLCNLSINDVDVRSMTGSIIIGLWKEGNLIVNPPPEEILDEGTTVLVMGTKRQLNLFYRLIGGIR
jgi:Trk K+ transport system NAD-binding subunit